jgi:hypothetical protein
MLISHSHKFIFIHVPKTGGSSFTAAVAPYLEDPKPVGNGLGWQFKHHTLRAMHIGARQCGDALQKYPRYLIVSNVRNPYSRAVSLWNSSHRKKGPFKSWHNKMYGGFHRPQSFWLTTAAKPDIVVANILLRFEHLEEDFIDFCKIAELPSSLRLPHKLNKNYPERQDNYMLAYKGNDMKEKVRRWYDRDFKVFDYPTEMDMPPTDPCA